MTAAAANDTNHSAANTTNGSTRKPSEPATPVGAVRDAAGKMLDTTLDTARDAARQASQTVEANPLGVLIGGVALGVLAGAMLPQTRQETRLLGPLGRRITDQASGAIKAARDAGKGELDMLGISRDAARGQAGKMIEGVLKAVATAGAAAVAGAAPSKDAAARK